MGIRSHAMGGKHVCNCRLHTAARRDSTRVMTAALLPVSAQHVASFLPLARRHVIICVTVASNCFEWSAYGRFIFPCDSHSWFACTLPASRASNFYWSLSLAFISIFPFIISSVSLFLIPFDYFRLYFYAKMNVTVQWLAFLPRIREGGPEFNSRPGDQPSWLRYFCHQP
jgi:hypothetical protein